MANAQKLQKFYHWLQGKGDDPCANLIIKWLAEFAAFADEDERLIKEFKEWVRVRSGRTSDKTATLKSIAEFEDTIEEEDRLEEFKSWVSAKADRRNAALARWWIDEFESIQASEQD
jgi:hypothetical protein